MIFNKQQHGTKKFTTLWNKANLLNELLGIPYAKYACTSLKFMRDSNMKCKLVRENQQQVQFLHA